MLSVIGTTSVGLKNAVEMIDNRSDFKTYMQNYAYAHGNQTPRGPRREGPPDEGFVRACLLFFICFD